LCDKNFYLGHTASEHYLVPVSTAENIDAASDIPPVDPAPTTISDIDDDYDTVDNNVLETNGSLVYQPEQPECPSTPAVIDAIDGTNFEPPPPEPIPTLFEAPEPNLVLAKVVNSIYQCLVCAASFDSLDRYEAHPLECHNTLARLDNQVHIVDDPTLPDELPPTTDDDVKLEIDELNSSAACNKTELLCTICGLKFKTTGKLKKHAKVHKTEKRRRKLVCEICNRVLADRASMEQHMDIHLEKKNFKCTFCGRLFRQKNNLIRHTRIHTGVRRSMSMS
jgi:Zinc finger, C2H2 type